MKADDTKWPLILETEAERTSWEAEVGMETSINMLCIILQEYK